MLMHRVMWEIPQRKQQNGCWLICECKHPCVSPWKIVETRESEREVRRGRVSIRDRPASLTFTVTLESLREEDAGTYGCGIYVPLSRDPTFQVEVSVIPGEPETPALGLLTYLGP